MLILTGLINTTKKKNSKPILINFTYLIIFFSLQVELYIPRKCDATNRIIKAKDHASVQINIVDIDENGRAIPGKNITYNLCGFVRSKAESDDSLNRLAQQDGLLKNVFSYRR